MGQGQVADGDHPGGAGADIGQGRVAALVAEGVELLDIAQLETGLAEIGQMLERVAAAPSFDPRPIEDLSRRFEGLKSAFERQAATAPANAKRAP